MMGIEIVFWHWWVVAVVFLALEMIAAAYFFLWLGSSAALVGLVLFVMPDLDVNLQFGIWAMASIISVTAWYFLRKSTKPEKEDEGLVLNQRGKQYVGRTFTLEEPVVNGQGKINVDDSTWKIEADTDFETGMKIEVIAVEGTVLKVKPA